MRKALKLARKSAPGPDGISVLHWRALGEGAVDAICLAAKELAKKDGG